MRIERFDPEADPVRLRACYQAYLAGAPIDDPHCPPLSLSIFTSWLVCGWSEDNPEVWFAGESPDQADGHYTVAMPQRENRHLVYFHPEVPPARRRAGVGTAMLRHAATQAARLGRTTLEAEARDGSAGECFARALGARRGVTEVRRILDLTAVQADAAAKLGHEAREASRGYRVLCWAGTVPEEHLDQVAAVNAAMADAPHDAATQAQFWDADRVRTSQRRVLMQGGRYYSVAAQRAHSGQFAGLTQVGIEPDHPEWAHQEITAVTRPDRGHRLGLLIKGAMLDLLAEREPQLRWITTGNADSNSHMIAINEQLGYQVLDRWASWQLDVADVLAVSG